MGLLEAMEGVASAHVDRSEVLFAAMRSGDGADALVSVLEHGLEVLDNLTVARTNRKRVRVLCARVEDVIERFDDAVAEQLAANEDSELSSLAECLCGVERAKIGEADVEYLEAISRLLEELERCCDPVVGAGR